MAKQTHELRAALRRLEQELQPPTGHRGARGLFRDTSVELDIRDKILGPHREQLLAAIACARHVHRHTIACAYVASFRRVYPWIQQLLLTLREQEMLQVVREEVAKVYGRDSDAYVRNEVEISVRSRLLQIHSDVLMLALRLNEVNQRELETERNGLVERLTRAPAN